MTEIILDGVSKSFSNKTVILKKTSFTIRAGEFFILVGPSGCGKSTLLNMIIGLEHVSSGEIRVNGQVINDLDPKDRNMAMVFQSYAIYPHMSVRENIAFPLKIAKLSKTEIAHRVNDTAAILELTELLDRKPASLSGGQRQRVAMGRAIVREPKVFLLDEPLSNLDARLRVQMRAEIARLHKRLGTTMIYVTHDQTEAMTLGDRVAVMNQGEVQQIDTPHELYTHPANLFVASFIGSLGMNLLPAQIKRSSLILPFGEIELSIAMKQQVPTDCTSVVAGIRPEHFQYVNPDSSVSDELIFDVIINAVEWLGTELNVYFEAKCPKEWLEIAWPKEFCNNNYKNSTILIAVRLDPTLNIRRGDKISLLLDARKIQLFDQKTGKNYAKPMVKSNHLYRSS